MDYEAQYEQARQMAEQALKESLLDMGPHQELLQAMRYSLLAGGSVRPCAGLWSRPWTTP